LSDQNAAARKKSTFPYADMRAVSLSVMYTIHFAGHFETQVPQLVQPSPITARLFSTVIAFEGQRRAHMPQDMQPAEQTFLTSGPRHFELHATCTQDVLGARDSTDFGHVATQVPHPTHLSGSTLARPFTMLSAPKTQTSTQVPNPMQPNGQALGELPGRIAADLQSCIPS
jgi:hypothetical protein